MSPGSAFCAPYHSVAGVDPAIGSSARELSAAMDRPFYLDTSVYFQRAMDSHHRVIHELQRAAEEQGVNVSADAIMKAFTVLDALPYGTALPEIVIEDDGQVGLDWQLSANRMLSLNVGNGSMLGYAAVIGLDSSFGRVPFATELPERVVDLLRRLET